MLAFASVLLVLSTAFAYHVTYPGGSQGWNTTGPNYLKWERVDTDPLNFTVVLTNVNTPYDQVLNVLVDGTLGSVVCNPPSGGWPTGSAFRANLAQDAKHPDSLLAQSSEFNITSDKSTTTSASIQIATSATTATPSVSSSDTSTTPTGTSAAPLSADAQAGLLTALLAALVTTLF